MSEDDTPADWEADGDESNATVDKLLAEIQGLKEQVLRYAADAENTKRRAEREMNDARAYAIQKFARDLLGAADNLSRATAHSPKDSTDAAVKNFVVGIEMTEKELQGAFERNGLKKIDRAQGEKFDPHLHQAVMEQPSTEVAAGGVISVLQAGYELMGRLVRPAMVAVAAKGSTGPSTTSGGASEQANGAANPYGGASADFDNSGGAFDTKA